MMDKIFRYTPYILYFRSVTFVFLILTFNTFYFLRRTSLKTTYLRDGRFLLKDCLLLLLLLVTYVLICLLTYSFIY